MSLFLERSGPKAAATLVSVAVLSLGIVACDSGTKTSLSPDANPRGVPLPTSTFHLKADGKTILESGDPVPIAQEAVVGYIDSATPEGRFIDLGGWAASAKLTHPADSVVGFVGKQAVAALEPTGARPDVVDAYGNSGLEGSGFVLRVPALSLDCAVRADGLGVFGIANGAASPLPWLEGVNVAVTDACRASRTR